MDGKRYIMKTVSTILILFQVVFKTKNVNKGKKEHFIWIKESILKEDITVTNVYMPNNFKIQKQKLTELKGEIDKITFSWRLLTSLSQSIKIFYKV